MLKIISVFFSGTIFSINDRRFLTTDLYLSTNTSESQISMGFNGCGEDFGFNGMIFGSGLDKQCKEVIDVIIREINAGHQITLNVYGHSRGAIAALLLAKQLGNIDTKILTINLALLDPVPGNFITTANIDPFKISLANKTMDLSDCKPLKKVLALYPHIPLPAIMCHAPLLVTYPPETEVEEEVVNGCHAQAEQVWHPSSELVRLRVEEFLIKNGTDLETYTNYQDTENIKQTYLELYSKELKKVDKTLSREAHSARGMVITATPEAKYFNNRHKALAEDSSQAGVCLKIEPEKGIFSQIGKFFTNYPLVGQALKWTMIALSVAAVFYFTGGIAAIPLLIPIVDKLGALSLLALAPAIGATLAALWYGAVKPILSWCASKFFYPHYATPKIEVPQATRTGSTSIFTEALGTNLEPDEPAQILTSGSSNT